MVAEIAALVIFVIMFLLIVLDRIPRQWVTLGCGALMLLSLIHIYSPLLKDYTTDAYTKVITDAVEEIKPEILLFGASNIGRDLAPRCAARLHTGLCADCTHLDIDMPIYRCV